MQVLSSRGWHHEVECSDFIQNDKSGLIIQRVSSNSSVDDVPLLNIILTILTFIYAMQWVSLYIDISIYRCLSIYRYLYINMVFLCCLTYCCWLESKTTPVYYKNRSLNLEWTPQQCSTCDTFLSARCTCKYDYPTKLPGHVLPITKTTTQLTTVVPENDCMGIYYPNDREKAWTEKIMISMATTLSLRKTILKY